MLDILNNIDNLDTLFQSNHSRSVHRFSVTNASISFYSPKNRKTMFMESYTEMYYALTLERDTNVKRYQSQPFSFFYKDKCRYTPDFVEDRNGTISLAEVKSSFKKLNLNEIIKFECIEDQLKDHDADFSIVFVDQDDPIVKQQRSLYKYHNIDCEDLFIKIPKYTGVIDDLINKSILNKSDIGLVYSGIFNGSITTSESGLIKGTSLVSWEKR